MNFFWKKLILPLFLLLIVLSLPLSASAQSSQQSIVTLDKNQTVSHDYFAAGSRVIIDGTVNGDAYVAAGVVEVNGTITGDLLAAGGQVTVRGKVGQNIRAAGGTVLVEGSAGRNISVAGGNVTIDKSAKLNGNAALAGGNIEILSPVKDLTVGGGTVRLASNVMGNVTAGASNLELAPYSTISGSLNYWSNTKATIAPSAKVMGTTTYHQTNMQKPQEQAKGFITGFAIFMTIASFISSLILGMLFILLMPIYSEKTAEVVSTQFLTSLVVGLVTFIIAPILIVVLLITVIGLPLAVLLAVVYGVMLYISKIFVAYAAGRFIAQKANWKIHPVWLFIIGLVLYYLLGLIPFVGFFVKAIVVLVGLGVLLLSEKYYFTTLRLKKLL